VHATWLWRTPPWKARIGVGPASTPIAPCRRGTARRFNSSPSFDTRRGISRRPLSLLEEARHAGELTADGAARLIRLHLLAGDQRCGWQLLLDCCRHSVFGPRSIPCPDGLVSRSRDDESWLWGGGYGDEMLFVRYIPALAATGAIGLSQLPSGARRAVFHAGRRSPGVALRCRGEGRGVPTEHRGIARLLRRADGQVWPVSGPYLRAKPISLSTGRRRVDSCGRPIADTWKPTTEALRWPT